MTYRKNDARLSTLTDGTALTNSNSAFTDNFTTITASNGASVVMETTPKTYIMSGPDTGVGRVDWTISTARAAVTAMFDFTSIASSSDGRILTIFSTGSGANFGVILFGGLLRIVNFANATLFTTTQSVYSKRVRVFLGVEVGTGTADGEFHFEAFFGTDADSATRGSASTGAVFDSAVANTGTVNYTAIRVGKLSSGGSYTVPVEYIHSDDTQFTQTGLGPLASTAAPVLTYTKQTVVELDSNATNSGTVTLVTAGGSAVTPTSITGPDGSGVFRVVLPDPMTGSATLTMTATNGSGSDVETIVLTQTSATVLKRDFLTYDGTNHV